MFCEEGVFTPAESSASWRPVRRPGSSRGFTPTSSRPAAASQVAALVRARSADHLIFVDVRAASRLLAEAGTTATLLPIAAFYLKLGRFAPARALIDAGVPVASRPT